MISEEEGTIYHHSFSISQKVLMQKKIGSIIHDCKLISDHGYNCFTETPISSMIPLLEYFEGFPKPMYSKYAIGFNRDILIQNYYIQPVS